MAPLSLLFCEGLLFTASLLAGWNSNTVVARPSIKAVPPSILEGGDVLLLVSNQTEKLEAFFWYKGKRAFEEHRIVHYEAASQSFTWGPRASGREKVYADGSLLLQNVTTEDAGLYALETFETYYQCEITHVSLQVHKIVTQPYLQFNHTKRWNAAVLTCVSRDPGAAISWFFNYKPLTLNERMTLLHEKHRLSITGVSREDVGIYQCQVTNAFSSKTSIPLLMVLASG